MSRRMYTFYFPRRNRVKTQRNMNWLWVLTSSRIQMQQFNLRCFYTNCQKFILKGSELLMCHVTQKVWLSHVETN